MVQIINVAFKETLSKPFHSCMVVLRARAAAGVQKYVLLHYCIIVYFTDSEE